MRSGCQLATIWMAAVALLAAAPSASAGPYEDSMKAGQQALEGRGRDMRKAAEAFRRAAAADPRQALPHKYLAGIAYRSGDLQTAIAEARKVIAISPDDADGYYDLAVYLWQGTNEAPSQEVVTLLRRAVELNDRASDAANMLGCALFLLQQYDEAATYLERAARITPSWSPFHANLGEALLAAGKPREACEAFARAGERQRLKLVKGEERTRLIGDLFYGWARAEEGLGDLGPARSHLQYLISELAKEPGAQGRVGEARQLLAEIERKLQQQQVAFAQHEQQLDEELKKKEEELRKQQEEAERRRREEEARKQQEEAEKKRREEELRKQQVELQRLEAEKKRKEEELRKQQEEAARRRKEEELRKQEEELKKKQEELRKQEEEMKRREEEARKRREEEERRRKEEEEKRRKEEEILAQQKKDTVKPVITITAPQALQATTGQGATLLTGDLVMVGTDENETQLVAGVASDNTMVTRVTVAGKEATLSQSRDLAVTANLGFTVHFSAEVPVKAGENRIEVVAADRASNTTTCVLVLRAKRQTEREAAQDAVQQVAAAAAQRYALLVGVNQYESPEIPPLKFSVRDVNAVHQLLLDPKRAAFSEQNVFLLTDEQRSPDLKPVRRNIYARLRWLEQNARPEDMVVVYYSGHGFREKETGISYLLPADTVADDLKASAIPSSDFIERIGRISANKKVIILDACHSGGLSLGAKAGAKLTNEYYEAFKASEGTVTIASCSGDEQSYEYPGRQQGVFTHFLCEGLSGQADANRNGVVTFKELAEYVETRVDQWARRQGLKQKPLSHMGNARGDIPLSAVREIELERKKQKLVATFEDEKIRRYSATLLEKEPKSLTHEEAFALTALEQVLRGEAPKELYLKLVETFSLAT